MVREEYRLSDEQLREQNERGSFNWSLRPTVHLAPLLTVDARLANYFESIQDCTNRIATEHGEILRQVEAIIGQWGWDENINTVVLRWTSARGTFWQEFGVKTVIQEQRIIIPEGSYAHRTIRAI